MKVCDSCHNKRATVRWIQAFKRNLCASCDAEYRRPAACMSGDRGRVNELNDYGTPITKLKAIPFRFAHTITVHQALEIMSNGDCSD
jgi:hypothetical protein